MIGLSLFEIKKKECVSNVACMHDAAIGVLVRDTTPYLDCKNNCQSTDADYFGIYFELVKII